MKFVLRERGFFERGALSLVAIFLLAGCEQPDPGAVQKADMRNVIIGAEIYRSEKQKYPTSLPELERFVNQEIPTVDTWGQPIRFEFSERGVKCISNGPDKTPETADDLVWMTQDEGF